MAERGTEKGPRGFLRLRGHTLLCLQGFRGEGYSPEFIENLTGIHRQLSEHPDTWIEVLDEPDDVCAACPHRAALGCTLNGPGSEASMRGQDRDVLVRLGVPAGTRIRWAEILERIRATIRPDHLPAICGTCRWLPSGYCRAGIDALREGCDDRLPSPELIRPGSSSDA